MRLPWDQCRGDASPLGAEMATPSTAETKDLIILAERMGIPVDEAMRQLAQRIADVEPPGEASEVSDPPIPQVAAARAVEDAAIA